LLICALIIITGLFVFLSVRDEVFEVLTEAILSKIVGAKLTMHKFDLVLALGRLNIDGLKIQNPSGFSNDTLLDLPKISVKFDRLALAKGRLEISRADIYLKELLFEKDKQGKMNVDALKIMSGPVLPMHVDNLNLKILLVVEKDCRGKKPAVKGHYLNLDKAYRNINGFNDLMTLLVVESLKNAGIRDAKIVGISMLLAGPVAIPFVAVINDMGRGKVEHTLTSGADELFDISLKIAQSLGAVERQDKGHYQIQARIQGAGVVIKLKPRSKDLTEITVTAKKYFLAKDDIASGVLYEIAQQVNTKKRRKG